MLISRLTASDCVWQFRLRFLRGEALVKCRSEEGHLLMCEASALLFQHAAMAENEFVRLFLNR